MDVMHTFVRSWQQIDLFLALYGFVVDVDVMYVQKNVFTVTDRCLYEYVIESQVVICDGPLSTHHSDGQLTSAVAQNARALWVVSHSHYMTDRKLSGKIELVCYYVCQLTA